MKINHSFQINSLKLKNDSPSFEKKLRQCATIPYMSFILLIVTERRGQIRQ